MKEIYPGTIGRTHGEINDNKPNANAVSMLIFSTVMSYLDLFRPKHHSSNLIVIINNMITAK